MKSIYFYFYFIKSETSDSFVSHFDGHFAYLKTLDFYFKHHVYFLTGWLSEFKNCVKVEVAVPKKPHDFCGRKATPNERTRELCESRGGRPGLPVPKKPHDFCGRKAALNRIATNNWHYLLNTDSSSHGQDAHTVGESLIRFCVLGIPKLSTAAKGLTH